MKKLLVTAAILLAGTAIASARTYGAYESPSIRYQSEQNDEQSIGEFPHWQHSRGEMRRHAMREGYGAYGYSPNDRNMGGWLQR